MQQLDFRVAEAAFRIQFLDDSASRDLIPSYAPFYIKEGVAEAALIMRFSVGDGLVPAEAETGSAETFVGDFDCGNAQHVIHRTETGGYHMKISTPSGHLSCALRTTADFTHCECSVFGTFTDRAFGLNNALMICFAFSGAYHHILMMHSSVIKHGDQAFCFLGKSGTGKSTHSRLWLEHVAGSELLNDDNPVIRFFPERNEVRVFGTPWSGKTPCYRNLSAVLGGYLRLEQYPENILRRHRPIETFATILSSCSTMIWDKASYSALTETIKEVASRTVSFTLQCRPDAEAALLSSGALLAH